MNFQPPYMHHYYCPMFLGTQPSQDLPPTHNPPVLTLLMENITGPEDEVLEYHHFYGSTPVFLDSQWHLYYPFLYTGSLPNMPVYRASQGSRSESKDEAWPEGFAMKGELRWGKLERVFGVSRELPDYVKKDLRRVYGTYPSTAVSISCHRGEFVVRGDPRVGEQEYRVEKKLVQKAENPRDGDSIRENTKKGKKKRKDGKKSGFLR